MMTDESLFARIVWGLTLLTGNGRLHGCGIAVQNGYGTSIRVELLIRMRMDRALAMARTAASPGNSHCSIIGSEVQVFHQPTHSLLFSFFYCPLSMSQCDRVRELVTVKFMFRVWMMVEGPPFHHFTQGQGMKMQLHIRYPELGWSCHVLSSRKIT